MERALRHPERAPHRDRIRHARGQERPEPRPDRRLEIARRRPEPDPVRELAERGLQAGIGAWEPRRPHRPVQIDGRDGAAEHDRRAEQRLVARRARRRRAGEPHRGRAERRDDAARPETPHEDGERELVAHLAGAVSGRGRTAGHEPDLAAVWGACDLEPESGGGLAEVARQIPERRLDGGGARCEVVECAERAERDGEADLGRQLLAG